MKKQEYLKPIVKILPVGSDELLTGSGVTGNTGDDTIGYGGTDDDGSLDPGAKDFEYYEDYGSIWEDYGSIWEH